MSWRRLAKCRGMDPDLFHPARGQDVSAAKAVCDGCPVRSECLSEALQSSQNDDQGVWGGTSARERMDIRRKLGKTSCAGCGRTIMRPRVACDMCAASAVSA